ncbi:unnamed protein product [Pseudo-nitzschia multistriata]|uniref:Major facilitator superfamily (MFS) profile domain-containing protein n=1 Tax=Pseudo-nitzschia multistriata TaxID=183589 RepID=A0A448ZG73_9STRA|nr:unnamed protein product [Pseudo-nitzschia multistriata]
MNHRCCQDSSASSGALAHLRVVLCCLLVCWACIAGREGGGLGVSAFVPASSLSAGSSRPRSIPGPVGALATGATAAARTIAPRSTTSTTMLRSKSPATRNDDEEEEAARAVRGPFALLLASQFLLFIGVGAVIPSIPLYGKEIGLSGAANGIVVSAPAVALFLAASWSGRRADLARKPAMMVGMAVIAASDLGTALATGLAPLVVARLGLGAGRSLSEAGERGMLVDLANQIPELRGRALAAQQAVVALGIAIGAPAGGLVVEEYGPRAAFLCVTAAALVALVLYAFLPETVAGGSGKDDSKSDSNKSPEDAAIGMDESTPGLGVWAELLKRNDWRGLAVCQSGVSFGYAAKIASVPILAASALPGGALGAGALLSAAGLSGLVGAPIGGYLTDRVGSRGAAVLGGIVGGLGLVLVPMALNLPATEWGGGLCGYIDGLGIVLGGTPLDGRALSFSAAVLLWSLGASAQGPALVALAQERSERGFEATSLSLVKAAGDGTYVLAPFLLGLASDAVLGVPGIECALAGSAGLLGTVALAGLVGGEREEER